MEEEWLATTTADDDGEPAVAADAPSPPAMRGLRGTRGPSRTAFGAPSHPSFLVDGVAGDGISAVAGSIRESKVSITSIICVF